MQSRALSFERAVSRTLKALTLWSAPSDLALVHLPNLRHLDISGFSITPALPFILDFIKSSQCPLVDLRVVNCDLSVGSLIDVLKLAPLLEHLEIGFQGIVSQSAAVFVANVDQALLRLMFALGAMERGDEQVFVLVPELRTLDISLALGCGSGSDYTFHRSAKVIEMFRRRHAQNQMATSCSFGVEVVLIG
ncbi:hypothetical protein CPB85DRAFT_1433552 [Mucidula mucida]|nr:hypothetical protein CPB85DRAFT_1433552 [Mucidula mucida]